ncbi:MAG: RNA 3'-terminal phosphate cyclase [bacterium]
MIELDGATKSGSGTILRSAVSLASLLGEDLHLVNIRARRDKPGLRPQHLTALLACCEMTGGRVEGAQVGSGEIFYRPGPAKVLRRDFSWDIGTAGSTTMLAFGILPLAVFSRQPHSFTITGGLFQDFAPSAYHMQHALLPLLATMGLKAELKILQPGYVPQGQGKIELITAPCDQSLSGISLPVQGDIRQVQGISLSSHLAEQKVSQRMAETCQKILHKNGLEARFEIIDDTSAVQKGAALFVAASTRAGCLLGADLAGKPGRRSEWIADQVARMLLADLRSGASVDRHLADQLILFAGLAKGTTEYRIPQMTPHIETNLWLVNTILGAKTAEESGMIRIEGVGFWP